MIFKAKKNIFGGEETGLLDARFYGDEFKFTHAQNIEPILAFCHNNRKEVDPKAFNRNDWELIGTVPAIEFAKHPEWASDAESVEDWLKSDEGKMFRTSRRAI